MTFDGDVCFSGGAIGADLAWGQQATLAAHTVVHWSFAGHRTQAPSHQLVRLPDDLLAAADPTLHQVAKLIQRRYPPRLDNTRKLLQRNYYQIIYSNACYAVSTLKDDCVQGGTGWAVGAFQLLHPAKPLYVYCQIRQQWFVWQNSWVMIEQPPCPIGLWTGIGSRDLKLCGEKAIKSVFT